jgi:hypothetical protein
MSGTAALRPKPSGAGAVRGRCRDAEQDGGAVDAPVVQEPDDRLVRGLAGDAFLPADVDGELGGGAAFQGKSTAPTRPVSIQARSGVTSPAMRISSIWASAASIRSRVSTATDTTGSPPTARSRRSARADRPHVRDRIGSSARLRSAAASATATATATATVDRSGRVGFLGMNDRRSESDRRLVLTNPGADRGVFVVLRGCRLLTCDPRS